MDRPFNCDTGAATHPEIELHKRSVSHCKMLNRIEFFGRNERYAFEINDARTRAPKQPCPRFCSEIHALLTSEHHVLHETYRPESICNRLARIGKHQLSTPFGLEILSQTHRQSPQIWCVTYENSSYRQYCLSRGSDGAALP